MKFSLCLLSVFGTVVSGRERDGRRAREGERETPYAVLSQRLSLSDSVRCQEVVTAPAEGGPAPCGECGVVYVRAVCVSAVCGLAESKTKYVTCEKL